jgi:hypothetical protein
VRKPGLDIFQTFNEVGLAVKRSTGSQQPWVSSSPIDGSFYFIAPPPAAAATPDEAAQAWAATRDTTSLAVIGAFIQQHGNSTYGPFARTRREELEKSQVALVAAKQALPEAPPVTARLTKADVVKLFEPLSRIAAQVDKNFVERRDDRTPYVAANNAMRRAFPPAQQLSNAGQPQLRSTTNDSGDGDLNSVYETALVIVNAQPSGIEDSLIVEVAINDALAALDPHSGYITQLDLCQMQAQTRGVFGGVGLEMSMTDGLLKVVTPYDDMPGAKAGIHANDVITSIDNAPIQGLTLSQAVQKLRGPLNSPVKLRTPKAGKSVRSYDPSRHRARSLRALVRRKRRRRQCPDYAVQRTNQ